MFNKENYINKRVISPSLLSADFSKLASEVIDVYFSGAEFLHLDVIDGVFAPNITFGIPVIEKLRPITDIVFDTHLMIVEPIKYVSRFADAGSDIITFHAEAASDIGATIAAIREKGCAVGISIKPKTPLDTVLPYLSQVDMVLIMSVEPGFSGQKFMPEVLPKIEELKKLRDEGKYSYIIQVDGGADISNAALLWESGVDVMVAGNAVYGQKDRKSAIDALINS